MKLLNQKEIRVWSLLSELHGNLYLCQAPAFLKGTQPALFIRTRTCGDRYIWWMPPSTVWTRVGKGLRVMGRGVVYRGLIIRIAVNLFRKLKWLCPRSYKPRNGSSPIRSFNNLFSTSIVQGGPGVMFRNPLRFGAEQQKWNACSSDHYSARHVKCVRVGV